LCSQLILLIVATIVVVGGEPPKRAPYAAAGWRPQVPFKLPSEFQPPNGYRLEITKQRVEHAGTFDAPQFNSQYLPPQFDVPQQEQESEQQQQTDDAGRDQQRPANQYGAPAEGSFRINYPDEEQQPQSNNIREGRYFVISPDNKLQRVIYRTVEAQGDEFTAQLKYSPVGELQDPVYKYNSQGQLERVLK
ncbi:hypothetical protein KR044_012315, partial [Drosophila immigrans]